MFITVEGSEGAGKTTQLNFVRDYLKSKGKAVTLTREPGGTKLGEELRSILLNPRPGGMADDTELLLIFAARAEHIAQVIKPALEQGHWVLCDRFTDATYAYQGGGRGISPDRIATLENWVQGSLRPDLTLVFDLPVEQGLARANKRSQADRFESETVAFFERVRQSYLTQARQDTERYRIINAGQDSADVRHDVEVVLADLLTKT